MIELATKTMTADSRIGSQRAARGTMCSLRQCKCEYKQIAGEATPKSRLRSRGEWRLVAWSKANYAATMISIITGSFPQLQPSRRDVGTADERHARVDVILAFLPSHRSTEKACRV